MIMHGCDTSIINGSMKESVLYNHIESNYLAIRFTVLKILSFSSDHLRGS